MDFTSWDAGLHTGDGEHLEHYGVLGMKWGMRRFQNKDGTLTPRGQKHYSKTGEYGYHYKSHATKKYERKAKRAKIWADAYRDSIKEVKSDNDRSDIHENRNNKYINKWKNKAQKADAKYKKMTNRAKRSAELDKREQEAAKHVTVGRALATRLLLGGAASKGYQQYRAMAGGGNAGGATKNVARVLSYYGGSMGSRIAKAAYIRKGEKDHGIANAINKAGSKTVAATKYADEQIRKKRKQIGI